MSPARQAEFLVLALIAAVIGAIIGGDAILYREYVVIGIAVVIATAMAATWSALQLRSSLTLTGSALIVRTATKTHEIPFQQVAGVSSGAYGIYIRTSDDRQITSLVAENSRWSQRFGLQTRASVIVDAINTAIRAGHPPAVTAPAPAVPGHVPASVVTGEAAALPGHAPAARLVKTIRVSALMTVLGVACAIGWFAAVSVQSDSAAALLAPGTRAPGTVTGLTGHHLDVRFIRDGKPATATINLNDSSDVYHVGDRVTVVYDPAHPDRARTIREDGQNQGSVFAMVVLLVAGIFLLIGGISNLVRARRQLPGGVHVISLLSPRRDGHYKSR